MQEALFEIRSPVEVLLEPHRDEVFEAFDDATQQWQALVSAQPTVFNSRTRACYIYDVAGQRLASYFASQGATVTASRQYWRFVFPEQRVVFRIKKYRNRRLAVSPSKTRRSAKIGYQQDVFEGYEVYNVVLGYLLDASGTKLETVAVSLHHASRVLWSITVPAPASTPVVPVRTTQVTPPAVRPRKTVQESEQDAVSKE